MPAKKARSAPRPPSGLPEVTVAVRIALLPCRKAGKPRVFTAVRESSGESRLELLSGGLNRTLEAAVRNLTVAFVLIGAVGLSVGSSLAREVALHKHTAEELKSACDKAGGKFSQDPGGMYGCGTNCHGGSGTDCTVGCTKDQICTGQLPGAGRATNLLNALRPARGGR
jgi:hypothetical protein